MSQNNLPELIDNFEVAVFDISLREEELLNELRDLPLAEQALARDRAIGIIILK